MKHAWTLIAALLLFAFGLQAFLALPKLSATSDELPHLMAGYAYWTERDFRMNPEHPPLAKLIAAFPLLALRPRLDKTSPAWKKSEEFISGYDFLYTNDADLLLFWGRIPMILLACLGGVPVFLWAREMFGPHSAILALGLYAFSPNLLAHGMLVTTDVPLASFMTLALYLFWKQGSFPTWKSGAATGAAVGATMACKFSGAILPVVIVVLSAWRWLRSTNRQQQTILEVKSLLAAGLAALVVIEASYLFAVPPWTYVQNLQFVNANHNGIRLFYLFGNFS